MFPAPSELPPWGTSNKSEMEKDRCGCKTYEEVSGKA